MRSPLYALLYNAGTLYSHTNDRQLPAAPTNIFPEKVNEYIGL